MALIAGRFFGMPAGAAPDAVVPTVTIDTSGKTPPPEKGGASLHVVTTKDFVFLVGPISSLPTSYAEFFSGARIFNFLHLPSKNSLSGNLPICLYIMHFLKDLDARDSCFSASVFSSLHHIYSKLKAVIHLAEPWQLQPLRHPLFQSAACSSQSPARRSRRCGPVRRWSGNHHVPGAAGDKGAGGKTGCREPGMSFGIEQKKRDPRSLYGRITAYAIVDIDPRILSTQSTRSRL